MSVQRQIDDLRARRAAEWFEILASGRTDRNAEFVAWVAESPRHLDEFLKITALSQETRQAIHESDLDRNALLERAAPRIASIPDSPSKAVNGSGRHGSGLWRWTGGLAAALAVCLLAVLWMRSGISGHQQYATAVGEQRTLELADGSIVYLNALSKVQVRFADARRDIELVAGEALFKVAHDSQRPFRVHTHDVVVQAIGTQFNVAARADGTRVAVIEGKVRVSAEARINSRSMSSPVSLKAGEAARISPAGAIESRPASEAVNAIAWRQRQLVFEGTPLEEAAQEFNRYRKSMRIRIEGVAPGSHHYSGTFDADDPESFADLLSRERDLLIDRRGDSIVIRAR